ncbi:hypothetical protein [Pseudobutyrivibrio sp.]
MNNKELRKLFVDNVKIPRHDRDLLVSYMKLLDIANVDYTVDATNNEYNLTLHIEPIAKSPIKSEDIIMGVGTIKTDTIHDGGSYKAHTTPSGIETYRKELSEENLNEIVAKAISNIDSLAIESSQIKGIGLTSAKIANLSEIPLTTSTIANSKDIAKISDEGRDKDKPKEKSKHYFRVFTLNNDDYWQKIPSPGYGKTINRRVVDITKGEYLRAFEIFLDVNNISEVSYKNRTFVRFKVKDVHFYFERIVKMGLATYKEASLELFEGAYLDSVFMKKASNGTILNDTV